MGPRSVYGACSEAIEGIIALMNANQTFGFWTVVDGVVTPKADGYRVLCRCVCGTSKMVMKKPLLGGSTRSCGCHGVYAGAKVAGHTVLERNGRQLKLMCEHGVVFESRYDRGGIRMGTCPCERNYSSHAKHGEAVHKIRTREYNCWRLMRQRCNDPENTHYSSYGGRGITVCERWDDFANFLADMGRCPPRHSIDRKDNDKGYSPDNCRWADKVTQARNKRASIYLTLNGKTLHIRDWAVELGVSFAALYQRHAKNPDPASVLRKKAQA